VDVSKATSDEYARLEKVYADIDQSIDLSAPSKPPKSPNEKTYHYIPYPKNVLCVGRKHILNRMTEELAPRSAISTRLRTFALHGMPGVGKTQTALNFVYDNLSYFKAVFWVSASTEQKILQGFVGIATLLNLSEGTVAPEPAESVDAVKKWLGDTSKLDCYPTVSNLPLKRELMLIVSNSTGIRWLLVFDNVDDLKMLNRYWPTAGCGSILVTSQNPSSEYALAHQGAKVEPFDKEETLQFLDAFLGRYLGRLDEEAAMRLARTLGYHPLALTQIASFILESSSTIPAVLEMLTKFEASHKLLDMDHSSLWYNDTVEAAFELSISRLTENTRRTMGVLCFFDPDSIPEALLISKGKGHQNQLLSHLESPLNRGVLVKDLRRFTLVNKNMETQTLTIHRLVQGVVFKQLKGDISHLRISFETALQLLHGAFPLHSLSRDHMTEVWPRCEVYLPHVLAFHENYRRLVVDGELCITSDFIELMYSCAW
jgi:DNA polymerase III delta prime subunit